jgi:hypothetical protein
LVAQLALPHVGVCSKHLLICSLFYSTIYCHVTNHNIINYFP